jgi:hypothetical protein
MRTHVLLHGHQKKRIDRSRGSDDSNRRIALINHNLPSVLLKIGGRAVAQWLRLCATNRQVAGSFPDGVIGIFQWHNPVGRTMVLGSTQLLTEMSTRCISWG